MPATLAIPTAPSELEEMLNDKNVVAQLFNDPQNLKTWITNYMDATQKNEGKLEILAQVKEQAEKVMVDWLRENGVENVNRLNLDPNSRKAVPRNTLYNKHAIGAEFDDAFDDAADYFYKISNHAYKTQELSQRLDTIQNAMSSLKPSDGGFLIPEVLRAEILQVALETAIVRPRARVIPMDSLTVQMPTVDSTSNVSSVHGGVVGYWTEEGATLTESKPRFGRVKLEAHKLTLYTEVPNELLQDSRPALDAFLNQMFPEAVAWFEDVAFFVGGGVGEPLGFLNAPAAIEHNRAASAEVEWADIIAMYSRMLPQSLNRAVWIISPEVLPQLLNMTNGGTTIVPMWIGGNGFPSAASAAPITLLGRPVIISEKASQLGTTGDINFVDFGFYLIGDRQAMSARQSEHFRFNTDVTAFRVTERLDGRPWLASAITPQNGGDTLSPFVKLNTE